MFKQINGGKLPQRAKKYSASFDVYANEDVVIGAGETKPIGLGIAIDNSLIQGDVLIMDKTSALLLNCHYLELHIDDRLVEKGLIAPPKIVNLDCVDEIKMVVHNPIKYYKNFKKVKPDGDSNREYFYITDNGLIGDNIWENSHSDNELYEEGRIFKTWEQAKYYKDNHVCTIKKGDKIGQLILKRHEGVIS